MQKKLLVLLFQAIMFFFVLASIAGIFGKYSMYLDIFSHFKPLYSVVFFLCFFVFFFAGIKKHAVIALVFFSYHAWAMVPYYIKEKGPENVGGRKIKLLSANINTENKDYTAVLKMIHDTDADVIFILEPDKEWMMRLLPEAKNYKSATFEPRDDNMGVAVFSKFKMELTREHFEAKEAPTVFGKAVIDGQEVNFVSVHVMPPVKSDFYEFRNRQYADLAMKVRALKGSVIVAGDFNSAPWSYWYDKFRKDSGLKDSMKGFGIENSWIPLALPIDHCFTTPDVRVTKREILGDVGSDHYPLYLELTIPKPSK